MSLQQPTSTNTTIANHGRHWWIWPPSALHEAFHSALTRWMDGWQPPEQADIIFEAVGGVYVPQNTPILWRCIIAGTKERFEGHTQPQSPPQITSAISGVCCPSIRSIGAERKASCGALGGHFRRWRPWLWRSWCQFCFVLRLLKNAIKTLKLVVCKQCLYTINYVL